MRDVCRTCLKTSEKQQLLFDNPTLLLQIRAVAPIKFSVEDNLPKTICEECIENINKFYNFQIVIINSDTKLRSQQTATVNSAKPELRKNSVENNSHELLKETKRGVCNICGKMVRLDNLSNHIRVHSEKPVTCEICGRTLRNSNSLRGHLELHKNTSFPCKICGQILRSKQTLHRHLKIKHTDDFQMKIVCHLCSKRFLDKHALQKHLRTHTGERPYNCEVCNKTFSSSFTLKTHTHSHTDIKPFICEYCRKGFVQKVQLQTHLKVKHASAGI